MRSSLTPRCRRTPRGNLCLRAGFRKSRRRSHHRSARRLRSKAISGKIYRFSDNELRLSTVSLRLDGQSPSYAYELKSARPDGPAQRFEGPIGLDGVYRTSAPTSLGITAAKGAWSYDKSFVAQLQELGADDLRTVILSFKDKAVDLIFKPREGPAVELRGEASD